MIGKGSYGFVYLVKDKQTGKEYAAKISKDPYDPKKNKSFSSEKEVYLKLKNPAVLTLFEYSFSIFNHEKHKVDVYAFSLIAYELLTRKKPNEKIESIRTLSNFLKKGNRPDLSYISDLEIQSFLKECWSGKPFERPSFNLIVEEIMSERYKKYFNADEKEVNEYLDIFDEKLKNRNFNGNFDIKKVADEEDVQSMFFYGMLLYYGNEVPINKEESAKYFKMAADRGNIKRKEKIIFIDMNIIDKKVTDEIIKFSKYYFTVSFFFFFFKKKKLKLANF